MKRILKLSIFTYAALLFTFQINAQETKEDTLFRVIEKLQSDVTILSKLKISGYVQAQYQIADTAAQSTVAGGSFPADVDQRFMIRRGRIKFAYTTGLSSWVLQFDASESGFSMKDIYFKYTDPWANLVTFTGGIFNRNFGYDIEYSSSVREAPERPRIFQTLFPGERDMGAMLTIQPRKTSNYNFIKLDMSVLNGTGPTAKDFDSKKDFITRLTLNKSFLGESLKVGVGGSYYLGSMLNYTDATTKQQYVWKMTDGAFAKDSSRYSDRIYKGLETQIVFNSPIGLTQLRGEYLWGQQPGTTTVTTTIKGGTPVTSSTSTSVSTSTPSAINTGDTYLRDFSGYYVNLSQNIGQLPLQLVARYDVYDPNTKVSGKDIGVKNKTGVADIKYSTFGFGVIFRVDANIKLTAYYDNVTNETTSLLTNSGKFSYQRDVKDNLFTLRLQYKF
jgi:phosphate-selective porin